MNLNEVHKLIKEQALSGYPFYCYVLRREHKKPFYIGVGKGDRIKHHEYQANGKGGVNKYKDNIIRLLQASGTGVDYDILGFFETREQALGLEVEMIEFVGRKDLGLGPLVNMTAGGEGGNNRIVSQEWRDMMSRRMSGENHPSYGKPLSIEHRRALSVAGKGRKMSDKARANMRKPRGPQSEEHRQKIRETRLGKKAREATLIKMSESQKKHADRSRQQMVELNNNEEVRLKVKIALDEWRSSPENKLQAKESMLALWQNPEFAEERKAKTRKALLSSMKNPRLWATKSCKQIVARNKQNPLESLQEYLSCILKGKPSTRSESLKLLLADDEYKNIFIKTIEEFISSLKQEE